MTIEEFINFGNTLQSLQFRLWNNENMNMWLTYRNEKDRGHLMDVSLFIFLGDNEKPQKEYRYKIYQTDSLSEAKAKLERIYNVIQEFE